MARVVVVFVVFAAGSLPCAGLAAAATQRITASGELLGRSQQVAGSAAFPVPGTWTRENRTALPRTAHFTIGPAAAAGCIIRVAVSARGAATRATTAAQVRRALGPSTLRDGRRAHGSWGVAELPPAGRSRRARLYAIGSVHLTEHKYLQLRAFAFATGDCPEPVIRRGPVPRGLARIVEEGTVDARVVPAP
jgi:hypothetical protein